MPGLVNLTGIAETDLTTEELDVVERRVSDATGVEWSVSRLGGEYVLVNEATGECHRVSARRTIDRVIADICSVTVIREL